VGTPISFRSEMEIEIPSAEQSTNVHSPGSFLNKIKISRDKVNSILKKRLFSERNCIDLKLLQSRKISYSSYLNVPSHLSNESKI
jgi:hypothetical protein